MLKMINILVSVQLIVLNFSFGLSPQSYSFQEVSKSLMASSISAPTFSLKGGNYTNEKLISLKAVKGDIYYTTDNSTPTSNSTKYKKAIKIKKNMVIKAIACEGSQQSQVSAAKYLIGKNNNVDERMYAHGINFVQSGSKKYLIWSDAYKSGTTKDGSWTHDIFYQNLSLKKPQLGKKKLLIKAPEAQEPASASVSGNGSIIVTFEDGYKSKGYTVSQRYAIYNKNLKVIKKYPNTIAYGGHSGHSASTDKYHTVFWSDDWVDGGGVNNLGTGKSVHITTLSPKGGKLHTKKVTQNSKSREWWPIAAASKKYVMLVWQRYVPGQEYAQLMSAIYDPAGNRFVQKPRILDKKLDLLYYSYSVNYLKASKEFVIIATRYDEKANVYLLGENGKVRHKKTGLRGLVRGASPAVRSGKNRSSYISYPEMQNQVASLVVKKHKIYKGKTFQNKYAWSYRGISGFYSTSHRPYFAALARSKLAIKKY